MTCDDIIVLCICHHLSVCMTSFCVYDIVCMTSSFCVYQLSVRTVANAIDVPVWVERQTVDLKICMFDRLYQDTIVVNNRLGPLDSSLTARFNFKLYLEQREA